ncbi:MAG: amidohydrolase [Alphaproteobacteria bacterium]
MASPLTPDMILRNGKIATLDADDRFVEALAVKGGRIVALGGNDEIDGLKGSATEVIDLAGRLAIPGIIDSHCHPDSHAIMLTKQHAVSWPEFQSLDAVLDHIDKITAAGPADRWFIGYRYDDNKFDAVPTIDQLDAAGNGRPVFIQRTDSHVGYANSAACALVGYDKDTPDPPFGRIDKHPDTGEMTGLMRETAAHRFRGLVGADNQVEDYVAGLPPLFERFLSHGVTSLHNSLTCSKAVRAYQIMKQSGRLHLRVGVIANGFEEGMIEGYIAAGIRSGFGDEWVRLVGVEWCPDCSTSGRTAAYYDPYVGTAIPGEPVPNTGMLLYDAEDLTRRAMAAHAAGLRIQIEGIGDRGIDFALDTIEACLAAHPVADHRIRIEHCCHVTPEILARIKRAGVIDASATGFMHDLGDAYIKNRGAAAMADMWPHRSLIDAGIPAPGHSDAPVCDSNPWRAIWSLVTRKTDTGNPIGPDQAVTITEALRAYTTLGAYAGGEEAIKGSLETGKLADIAVLDRDIFTVPDDDLLATQPDLTIVGGAVQFRR